MYQYFDKIRGLLDVVEKEEKANIDRAISMMVHAIENKNSLFSFGASHAGIITQELFYRAGGLMSLNPIFGREIMLDTEPISQTSQMERLVGYGKTLADKTPFAEGDILILHSVSGRNPVIIEMAMEAKQKGVNTIALTNLTFSKEVSSRHPSGNHLYEVCDIVIDNHGDKGDAACEIKGIDQKVSPSSTVIGATLVNTLVSEVVQQLVDHGMENPPIFYSANLDKGDELNRKLYEEYKDTIHYAF